MIGSAADSLALTYTVTTSIEIGESYLFQYRAKNIHGWSEWSPSLTLIAASVPDKITPAVQTFNEDDEVRISWEEPAYNGGKPITSYTVKILQSDGSTYSTDSSCDGSDATILSNKQCQIPMINLLGGSFNLNLDDLIVVIVTAENVIGSSDPSDPNTSGAIVMTQPDKPSSPVRDDSLTSDT